MYLCKLRVEKLRGKMLVSSMKDVGTTVCVCLPVKGGMICV